WLSGDSGGQSTVDKESAQEFVQETLQEVWETADDWFIH
ncbi:DinI-like family protein, partial [Escherichia coli]|nr:DinI-like family protein [Escherichia coli]